MLILQTTRMKPAAINAYDATISGRGLRMTEQRRAVYDTVMDKPDHPTAVEVFMRTKGRMPSISLATVYNCLDTLVACGVIRQVHHDRESSRYCANLVEHAHLFCDRCGAVADVPLRSRRKPEDLWSLPEEAVIVRSDVAFHGLCPICAPTSAVGTAPGKRGVPALPPTPGSRLSKVSKKHQTQQT